MKFVYITDDELKDYPKVTTAALKKGKFFHPDGLFSEQIFGPIKSNKCQCKVTTAVTGQTCPKCGVKITSSSMRRTQFAVIEVPTKLVNPVVMEIFFSSPKLKQIVNKVLNLRSAVYVNGNDFTLLPLDSKTFEIVNKENIENFSEDNVFYGLDALYEIACRIVSDKKQTSKSKLLGFLKDMIEKEWFFTKYIVVIPPDLRPALITQKVVRVNDDINSIYLSILLMLEKKPLLAGDIFKHKFECELQLLANQLNTDVFKALSGKEGLIRGKMSGKRIDYSARSVIVINPNLPITHIGVSRLILLQLFKLEIAKELIKEGKFISFKTAFDYLQKQFDEMKIDVDVRYHIDRIATDRFIIFNRQPTLHKGSMFAAKIKPTDGNVIELSPLHCPPLNADFDGDSVFGDVHMQITRNKDGYSISYTGPITDLKDLDVDTLFETVNNKHV